MEPQSPTRFRKLVRWRPQRTTVPLAIGAVALGDFLLQTLIGGHADSGLLTFAGTMGGIWVALVNGTQRRNERGDRADSQADRDEPENRD